MGGGGGEEAGGKRRNQIVLDWPGKKCGVVGGWSDKGQSRTIDWCIQDWLQALWCEEVDDQPVALCHNQIQVVRPGEVACDSKRSVPSSGEWMLLVDGALRFCEGGGGDW